SFISDGYAVGSKDSALTFPGPTQIACRHQGIGRYLSTAFGQAIACNNRNAPGKAVLNKRWSNRSASQQNCLEMGMNRKAVTFYQASKHGRNERGRFYAMVLFQKSDRVGDIKFIHAIDARAVEEGPEDHRDTADMI